MRQDTTLTVGSEKTTEFNDGGNQKDITESSEKEARKIDPRRDINESKNTHQGRETARGVLPSQHRPQSIRDLRIDVLLSSVGKRATGLQSRAFFVGTSVSAGNWADGTACLARCGLRGVVGLGRGRRDVLNNGILRVGESRGK